MSRFDVAIENYIKAHTQKAACFIIFKEIVSLCTKWKNFELRMSARAMSQKTGLTKVAAQKAFREMGRLGLVVEISKGRSRFEGGTLWSVPLMAELTGMEKKEQLAWIQLKTQCLLEKAVPPASEASFDSSRVPRGRYHYHALQAVRAIREFSLTGVIPKKISTRAEILIERSGGWSRLESLVNKENTVAFAKQFHQMEASERSS